MRVSCPFISSETVSISYRLPPSDCLRHSQGTEYKHHVVTVSGRDAQFAMNVVSSCLLERQLLCRLCKAGSVYVRLQAYFAYMFSVDSVSRAGNTSQHRPYIWLTAQYKYNYYMLIYDTINKSSVYIKMEATS